MTLGFYTVNFLSTQAGAAHCAGRAAQPGQGCGIARLLQAQLSVQVGHLQVPTDTKLRTIGQAPAPGSAGRHRVGAPIRLVAWAVIKVYPLNT